MRKSLVRGLLLGLCTLPMYYPVSYAGMLTPGSAYTSDDSLTVANYGVVIDQAGTYDINNTSGTLELTNAGTNMKVFSVNNGDTVNVNGNILVTGTNLIDSGVLGQDIQISNGIVNVNGNFTYNVDNSTVTSWIGSLMNIGDGYGETDTIEFNVSGDLTFINTMKSTTSAMSLLTAYGTNTVVNVDGNLYFYNRLLESVGSTSSGANVLYANAGATINVNGNAEIYSISDNPDAITVKRESTINLNGTTNKVIGNISFIDTTGGFGLANGGTLTAVFDGADSFWYGDEQNYVAFWKDSILGAFTNLTKLGTLDFTFKNGAEWIYFGDDTYYDLSLYGTTYTAPVARAKYISAITLLDGGIVNLQDEDIQAKLSAIEGLVDVYPELLTFEHNFVTIGDLKGSNGIFKIDLSVTDKYNGDDIIYVESSSDPGQHYISFNLTPDELEQISASNTLRFATTAAAAGGVSFTAEKSTFADSLMDYQVLIETTDYATDSENTLYNAKYGGSGNAGDTEASAIFSLLIPSLATTYAGGTNWYISGTEKTVNPIVDNLINATAGAYDFALDLDTLNKRQGNAQYLDDREDGIWVRMKRGSREVSGVNSGTYSMYQIGYDKLSGDAQQRIGIALDYKKGSSGIKETGSMENRRHGITVYDTLSLNEQGDYLDLVARYGKIDNEFNLLKDNETLVKGDYDNRALILSAEYGKKYKLEEDKFFEPQFQLQYGHLSGASYQTENGFKISTKSANSLVGRLGFRLGKETEKKDQYYLKANVLHEFSGGQDMTLSDAYTSLSGKTAKRGTWYDVGIGGTYNIDKNLALSGDIDKTFGADVKGWEFNINLTYSW